MSRESYQPDQYTGVRQSAPYVNQNPTLLSTPGNMTYIHGTLANMQYRDTGNVGFQPTLGQMADQFQERARAEARLSNTRSGGSDSGAQGVDEYYDYAAVGIDGGVDHYDDDGNDDEGDGDGEDDPALIAAGNESTGRWTRAEHELFLQALKKFGKEWKKVASMVKTRTVVQTRTHAQKYFQKLTKSSGGSGGNLSGNRIMPSVSAAPPGGLSVDKAGTTALYYNKHPKQQQRSGKLDGSMMMEGSPQMTSSFGGEIMQGQMQSQMPMQGQVMGGPGAVPMHMPPYMQQSMQSMQGIHPSMLLNTNVGMVPPHLISSYIPTTQGYGELDGPEFSESNHFSMLLGELQKQQGNVPPPSMQTPTQQPLSLGMPQISTSGIEPPDFPEPSPAACGKRKHAELQAAHSLAESSSSRKPRGGALMASSGFGSMSEYTDALIASNCASNGSAVKLEPGMMQSSGSNLMRNVSTGSMPGSSTSSRRNRLNLTLSIADPSEAGMGVSNDPGTPWEAAIQVLEQQNANAPPTSRLMRSNSFSNYTMPAVPVSTPSEQRSFINKVRALVRDADLAGFASLLGAAEYSAQSTVVKAEDGVTPDEQHTPGEAAGEKAGVGKSDPDTAGEQPPVSNLMTAFTPDGAATAKEQKESEGSRAEPEVGTPGTAERRRVEALNTQFNSGVSEVSPRRPSASLLARSLNRIDRNARSVLMDVAATSDPTINQTLLYSMCMLLIEHGANASLPDGRGNTALHYAAAQGHERVGRLLLTKGCPLNLQNLDGDTATHIAARHGHVAFIEMLADLGANFHIRNAASMCALDLLGSKSADTQRAHLRKLMLTAEPRLRTLVLYHEDFQEHTARRPSDWEGPDRLEVIMKRLRDKTEFPEHEMEISNRFEKADVELLGRVHSPEYIAFVNMLSKQVQNESNEKDGSNESAAAVLPFTPQVQRFVRRLQTEELKSSESCDTSFSVGTLSAARRAAGAVAFAVDRVMLGRNRNVFCAVRPPGHHAGYRGLLDGANSCGFCIFNNVAAGALHALVEHQCERVAIIDLDVHHGNGTEDIVRRYAHPSRLFFFSLHLYDKDEPAHAKSSPAGVAALSAEHSTTAAPATATVPAPVPAPAATAPVKTTTDRPIDAVTAGTGTETANTSTARSYEFYPGTGMRDDHIHNIINVPLTPLWAADESSRSNGNKPAASPHGQFMGRAGYRQAIEQRLIPSLRAFNPTLILLSIGFDAAAGDVGNCRQFPGEVVSRMGIDLQPEDFAWATTEIMKIADICCCGRLVSVLEGGYGEYAAQPAKTASAVSHVPTTRGAARHGTTATGGNNAEKAASTAAPPSSAGETPKSAMNRGLLGKVAAAHVHRLMDPYGGAPDSPPAATST